MKKKRIFIISAIIIVILSVSAFIFYFLFHNKEIEVDKQNLNNIKEEKKTEVLKLPFEVIKESFPHISEEKFREYEEMVKTNNFKNCNKDYDCVLTSSYLLENYLFCSRVGIHIHQNDENEDKKEHEEERKKILECSNFVLSKTLPVELSKCNEMEDRQKLLCFQNFVAPYRQIIDCGGIGDSEGVQICESVHRYKEATETLNPSICNNISNDFFRSYCIKHSTIK